MESTNGRPSQNGHRSNPLVGVEGTLKSARSNLEFARLALQGDGEKPDDEVDAVVYVEAAIRELDSIIKSVGEAG